MTAEPATTPAAAPPAIELVPLGELRIEISQQTYLEGVPAGGRLVGEAKSTEWVSDRVRASQRGASASDWGTMLADGSFAADARILVETHDGACITIRYTGKAAGLPKHGHPVIVVPTFETNDERYAWLNGIQAVGKGRRDGGVLVYDLYELR